MPLVACQRDSRLRSLMTRATGCTQQSDGSWLVSLEDTVLYPEGGGQPSDRGTISGIEVAEVFRESDGTVLHRTSGPVPLGDVEVVVDWPRRWDHMQQHSAQHLLTAISHDRFGLATTSFHLHDERCDIEVDAESVPEARLRSIEDAVNDAIRSDHPIRHRLVRPDELAADGVRTRGLPDGFEGPVRLVEIEGIDVNTCGGTHVDRTSELQVVTLTGTERLRGGTRIFFLAGDRVRRALEASLAREGQLTRLLTCGPAEHVAAVERLGIDARAGARDRKALLGELALHLGRQLGQAPGPVVTLHRTDADMAFLNAVASAAAASRTGFPDRDEPLLLLTAGGDRGEGVFLLSGPPDEVTGLGPAVADVLGGRGGGARGRFQGKASTIERRQDAVAVLRAGR